MKQPRIMVVGDVMLDHYLWGNCNRISPEAPVQVLDIHKETFALGGAGNVVNNLIAFGAKVILISVVGDDKIGKDIRTLLDRPEIASYIVSEKIGHQRKSLALSRDISKLSGMTRSQEMPFTKTLKLKSSSNSTKR